jgi:hypothetical protein
MVRVDGRAVMTGTVAGEGSKIIMPYSTPTAGKKSAVFRAGYSSDEFRRFNHGLHGLTRIRAELAKNSKSSGTDQ